jgi:N-acyl-D-amino-acid deacylase
VIYVSKFDLLIENATVVDGTGAPAFLGHVAVLGDVVTVLHGAVADLEVTRRIDATGRVVCPGFIDMHSHTGLYLLWDPTNEAKIRQGVTTEVIGVDGNSYAPFRKPDDLLEFVRINAGLDGRPPLTYDWDSVQNYLSHFDMRASVNVAMVIGNSALRISAMGWDNRPPSQSEEADMVSMLREGMEEGAFGISTGLDYPPGSHASTAELSNLSAQVAKLGGIYHTHVRYSLGDGFLDPFREAVEIGRRSGCPIHITHLYRRTGAKGGSAPLLNLIDDARGDGLDVTFDTYPYEWSSTRLLIFMPLWLQDGKPDDIRERMADPSLRDRIRLDVEARGAAYAGTEIWKYTRVGGFAHPANREFEGKTLEDVMQARDQDATGAIIDLLLTEDFGVSEVMPGPHGPSIPKLLAHPSGMIGSDSVFLGSHPSPRSYGTFPRVLGEFVRDEGYLGLEEAVRKMTGTPATRLGLVDRGLLRDGWKADLVVFDPTTVKARATYDEPRQFPEGIDYVVVNGQCVVDGGTATTNHPGVALRRKSS